LCKIYRKHCCKSNASRAHYGRLWPKYGSYIA
jgi:hypothetical protein